MAHVVVPWPAGTVRAQLTPPVGCAAAPATPITVAVSVRVLLICGVVVVVTTVITGVALGKSKAKEEGVLTVGL